MAKYSGKIDGFTMVPGQGGVFEFAVDGVLQYSKKELGRFPEDEEVFSIIESA